MPSMPEKPHKCKARQHSDQFICHECGLVWDANDPEPPVCGKAGPVLRQLPGEQATITDTSDTARDRVIAALRHAADRLELGSLRVQSGGFLFQENHDGSCDISSDLRLVQQIHWQSENKR